MRSLLAVACVSGSFLMAAPRAGAAQGEEPAKGLALWVRMPVGFIQNAAASFGAPQFTIGTRRDRFGLGLGLGFTVLRISDKNFFQGQLQSEEKLTLSLFQIGPSGWVDFWQSPDGRARGNIVAGLNIGRLSATDEDKFRDPAGNFQTSEVSSSGTLIGFHVGLGGDHFLHPHFALGIEAGFQGNLAFGIEEKGNGSSVGLWANGVYGAFRAMIVF